MLKCSNERFTIYNSDCYEAMKQMPSNSVDFQVYSPPFATLYIYSDDLRDLGNNKDYGAFFDQYDYIIQESLRVLRPGRLAAVHCKQMPKYKSRYGRTGIIDFRGEIIRHYEKAGFQYHSEVCIWTDPVLEMQKTKVQRLLYCNVRNDSTVSGFGSPEYLVIFRKWSETDEEEKLKVPVKHFRNYEEARLLEGNPLNTMDLNEWRKIASPVWFDIQRTDVLNGKTARDEKDEKHICPLQLEVIRRAIRLYTNPDEIVHSPFMGIGSEGYVALEQNRRFIGTELKESYYIQAEKNLTMLYGKMKENTLFD